jgi:heterodisulfide reductase subunit A
MVTLTIDGRKIQTEEGMTILEAAKAEGIAIPTLCYHKTLPSYGACRLCIVEIRQNGRDLIEASCTFPALEGLEVLTDTERLTRTRKVTLELHLARCPDSEEIRKMAESFGITKSRFRSRNEDCTLCGLCVRMCRERMGPAAIGFMGRGNRRQVGTPFSKLSDICQTCGACVSICPAGKNRMEDISPNKPIPIPSEFDEGLRGRHPIFIHYPQAVPRVAAIDRRYCVHLNKDECGICSDVCEAKAINYDQKEELREIKVGAVILTPGCETFDARMQSEYGYGAGGNVITSIEFERVLSASGPFGGHVVRITDHKEPKRIAFLQCVGSRDPAHTNAYCSSVCCTYAIKEAIIAKEHMKDGVETSIFYMDMRTFGKGFEEYQERAKNEYKVRFVRGRVSHIEETAGTKNLILHYESESGKLMKEEFDLVVLSVGLCPPEEVRQLASRIGVALNAHGFCSTSELEALQTTRPGVFVAGAFQEPKDIPETVVQASGAAAKAGNLIAEARGTQITKKEYPPEKAVQDEPERIGVFVCHCGINIGGVVNVPEVAQYARTLPGVVFADNNLYTCSQDTQKRIREMVEEHHLNRVVVASCSPRTHEPMFQETLKEAGLNPYLFEMANIRDQCSWVHMHEPVRATEKAKDLVRMAVAKARLIEPLPQQTLKVTQSALVIGGGVSGMTAALSLASQGFQVYMVEKEMELGGSFRALRSTIHGNDPAEFVRRTIEKVMNHPLISVLAESRIKAVDGFVGNFKTTVKTPKEEVTIEHGAIINAVGARRYEPSEYLYGKDSRVLTSLQFDERLAGGAPAVKSVAFINCVGSREHPRMYCSRLCCQETIRQAIAVKEKDPKAEVYVLYRDMRTYGFLEDYYRKARDLGVVFFRYDLETKPEVIAEKEGLKVIAYDALLGAKVAVPIDTLVLANGFVPGEDNGSIAQLLKVPLTQDGFFLEAHVKLRPVDFATEGIFICGHAHGPKSYDECISQAYAAASRAATILSHTTLTTSGIVAHVREERCAGCKVCVSICPYDAVRFDDERRISTVNEALCKGCGTCVANCPSGASYLKGFKDQQIMAQIEAACVCM